LQADVDDRQFGPSSEVNSSFMDFFTDDIFRAATFRESALHGSQRKSPFFMLLVVFFDMRQIVRLCNGNGIYRLDLMVELVRRSGEEWKCGCKAGHIGLSSASTDCGNPISLTWRWYVFWRQVGKFEM
jgi:hypothetical protein